MIPYSFKGNAKIYVKLFYFFFYLSINDYIICILEDIPSREELYLFKDFFSNS